MERKELGKITEVKFGYCGYQDACIGIRFTLEGKGWGVGDSMSEWDFNLIKHTENCKWTEKDRDEKCVNIVKYISDLLFKAKVSSVDKLKNIPVEVTFDGNKIKEWRILEEVL